MYSLIITEKKILMYNRKAFQKLMVFLKKKILRYDCRVFCIYIYIRNIEQRCYTKRILCYDEK